MRAAVRQTTRVLHNNKSLMEGIVYMQEDLKDTHQQGIRMVEDLQQNTAHYRGLASLSRDIHWIRQKQHDYKLLAAETQAGSDKRGFEGPLQAVGSERDAARQQTEERDSALKSAQNDYSELQKERECGQAAHEEVLLLCIRNETKCTRETILTTPIVRSCGVMEPSHEELLAQQQDPSGAPSSHPPATPSPHPGFLPPDRSPPALFLAPC